MGGSCSFFIESKFIQLVVEEEGTSVGKSGFVSRTKHTVEETYSRSNIYGSISFMIDNTHYVNFRI